MAFEARFRKKLFKMLEKVRQENIALRTLAEKMKDEELKKKDKPITKKKQ
jgi:demethoxyubiquinone hydroxylase (CLK1/Coq7/Cat5 family)